MATAETHPLRRRDVVHLADIKPRSKLHVSWERVRHRQAHWFAECAAEFIGVFIYIYAGVGSTVGFVYGNVVGTSTVSSLYQVGFAYSIGILLAFVVAGSTSGGHLTPSVTLSLVYFKGFPPLKALRYVVAQILGAYVACLFVYVQYGDIIKKIIGDMEAAGTLDTALFTSGPPTAFAAFVAPGSNLGRVFLNELVSDFVIGLVIWACIDPTNFFIAPTTGPAIIAFTFGTIIMGFALPGISTNSARDVGGRLMVVTIWGLRAGGGRYAAISALTNILSQFLAAFFYEYILADSSRVITPAHAAFINGQLAHEEHSKGTTVTRVETGTGAVSYEEHEKAHDEKMIEVA